MDTRIPKQDLNYSPTGKRDHGRPWNDDQKCCKVRIAEATP